VLDSASISLDSASSCSSVIVPITVVVPFSRSSIIADHSS
jgi:hypothetical protein